MNNRRRSSSRQCQFAETVAWLDFSESYPEARQRPEYDWLTHSALELQRFQNDLEQVIQQYSLFMDPEFLSTLNTLANSTLVTMLIGMAESDIIQLDEQLGFERPYNLLAAATPHIQEHTEELLQLISEFEDSSHVNLREVSELPVWSDDVSPHVNTARISGGELRKGIQEVAEDNPEDGSTECRINDR